MTCARTQSEASAYCGRDWFRSWTYFVVFRACALGVVACAFTMDVPHRVVRMLFTVLLQTYKTGVLPDVRVVT